MPWPRSLTSSHRVARDADEAIRLVDVEPGHRPDVVLMDLDLPGGSGILATRRIRELSPDSKVVVLTALQDPEVIADALAAGACGYVPKTRAVEELMDVCAGRRPLACRARTAPARATPQLQARRERPAPAG
jgi:DNA-binding NarL/FixJ family response regulator